MTSPEFSIPEIREDVKDPELQRVVRSLNDALSQVRFAVEALQRPSYGGWYSVVSFTQSSPVASTWYKVVPASGINAWPLKDFTLSSTDLTYTGTRGKEFLILALGEVSQLSAGTNAVGFRVALNGSNLGPRFRSDVNNGGVQSSSAGGIVTLHNGDVITLEISTSASGLTSIAASAISLLIFPAGE